MKRYGKIAITSLVVILIGVMVWIAAVLVGQARAAVTTEAMTATFDPRINTAAYVFIQIYTMDGAYVYDTTANSDTGGWTAIGSATFANTDIAVSVNTDFYVGQIVMPANVRSKRVIIRPWVSADATPDKADTQLTAFCAYYDANGWTKWPGPEGYSF